MNHEETPRKPFYTRARLTKRRIEVLRTIYKLSKESGLTPSMQDIANEMGMTDRQAAHNHVLVLRHNNLVNWKYHQPRTLRLTDEGIRLAMSSDEVSQA